MTTSNSPPQSSRPARHRRSVRRKVLGLAAAALVAVWLPFSAFYATTLNGPQAIVQSVHGTKGATHLVTTRTSTGVTTVANAAGGAPASQAVFTRSS